MSKTIRTLSIVAVVAATIAAANTAVAAPKAALYLGPGQGPQSLPKFGFVSYNNGWGEHVTQVFWGSRAQQFGLERHDIIMAINGRPLTYPGSWNDALREATYQGDFMTLKIRDRNTGAIVFRTVSIWGYTSPPPVVYKSQAP